MIDSETKIDTNQTFFGRLYAPDQRDKLHMAAPPPLQAIARRYKYWNPGTILDQGYTSQCVAYTAEGLLMASPYRNLMYRTPAELYLEAQRVDEWPGEEPVYYGTSIRAGMKVLQSAGYLTGYQWAFDAETVVRYILSTGPVALGTNWYLAMSSPDRYGFVHPVGPIVGGHAYLATGANRDIKCTDGTKGAIRFVNSWGTYWGQTGKAWMSFATLDRLIKEFGEAAMPKEVLKK